MKSQIKFLLFAILVIGIFIVTAKLYWSKLDKKHSIASGIITACRWGGRGSPFFITNYNFSVDAKEYSSSYKLKCKNYGSDTLKKRLVGLHVPVIYNPDKPWINTIAIEKETFKQYEMQIPDSLIPITDYLDCK